jgi:hypothetical protein
MKKILTVVITLILLVTAFVFFFVYKNSTNIPKTPKPEKQEAAKEEVTKALVDVNLEMEGKVIGIGEKQIAIDKPAGSEILNINAATPVLRKDGKTKSGLWEVKPGNKVKVSYENATKNVVLIMFLEK